ncbi:hypothetical protein CPB83DRAFT_846107 [Crepidotus variabilis]|uniref:Uncharacterized protein n=1 Tax=Crepidotus variabilis TaxID=179855 RepID=A0A9P6JUW5_9AGAR|nr:hypothetical protein CPB83DRAFT_846107 [Crepidotus variabilis]
MPLDVVERSTMVSYFLCTMMRKSPRCFDCSGFIFICIFISASAYSSSSLVSSAFVIYFAGGHTDHISAYQRGTMCTLDFFVRALLGTSPTSPHLFKSYSSILLKLKLDICYHHTIFLR